MKVRLHIQRFRSLIAYLPDLSRRTLQSQRDRVNSVRVVDFTLWERPWQHGRCTYCDATKSCCLLPKPLQEPLPQRDANHRRNLQKQVQADR